MTLDSLHTEWEKDGDIPMGQLDVAIRAVPLLHGKYWRLYTAERARFITLKLEHDTLRRNKFEWYMGRLDDTLRVQLGWPLQHIRIVRQEVEQYLTSDADLSPVAAKLEVQELKLKFIEDVIKSINGRGYLIKSAVEWLRFSQGS